MGIAFKIRLLIVSVTLDVLPDDFFHKTNFRQALVRYVENITFQFFMYYSQTCSKDHLYIKTTCLKDHALQVSSSVLSMLLNLHIETTCV